MEQNGLNWKEWIEKLHNVEKHLKNKASFEIIGSAALMAGGMPGRTSMDLDIWQPNSNFDLEDIKQACEKAGIGIDYNGTYSGMDPYLQIISELKEIPQHDSSETKSYKSGKLSIDFPPNELIVANKLACGRPKDLEDVAYMSTNSLDKSLVKLFASRITDPIAKENALENMIYLELGDIPVQELKTDKELFIEDLTRIKSQFNNTNVPEKKLEILRKSIPLIKKAIHKDWISISEANKVKQLILKFVKNETNIEQIKQETTHRL